MKGSLAYVLGACALAQVGCNFYSSCPCANAGGTGNAPATTGGTTNGTGGNGAGGTGGGAGMSSGGSAGMSSSGSAGMGPAPDGTWELVTNELAGIMSECGNMSFLAQKPDENLLIASIAQNGLFGSTDDGDSWNSLGQGKGSATITNRGSSVAWDPDHSDVFWLSGTYNGGGVYRTDDDGDTFQALGDISHCDKVGVDFTDSKRRTLVAGSHEMLGIFYKSTDGGTNWDNIGANLPTDTKYCTNPHVIDAQTYLVGCAGFIDGKAGILRTTDGGDTWTRVSDRGGSGAPLVASDGTLYWSDEFNAGIVSSSDDGETWNSVVGGGVLLSGTPIELPDGRIAGWSNDGVKATADGGATWTLLTTPLPMVPTLGTVIYSQQAKAFFFYYATCGFNGPVPVPDDAIQRYDYDWEAN